MVFDANPNEYLDSLLPLCLRIGDKIPVAFNEDIYDGFVVSVRYPAMHDREHYVAGVLQDVLGRNGWQFAPFLYDGKSIKFENPRTIPETVRNRMSVSRLASRETVNLPCRNL